MRRWRVDVDGFPLAGVPAKAMSESDCCWRMENAVARFLDGDLGHSGVL